jgi:predicted dehydrogenase
MDRSKQVAVWIAPDQVSLIREVAGVAGLAIAAAGSAVRGQSGPVASELGAEPVDDLRAMLATAACDLVLIGDPGTFGAASGGDDAAVIESARGRGVKVATLEPIPAAALDLVSGGWASAEGRRGAADAIRFCPLARLAGPFREATEVLQQFGHIRTMAVEAWCTAREGSLGARLYSGLELILALLGEPESVDAAYVFPGHGQGVHALPGESLRGLRGDLTASLRFADGRAASLVASDQGGRWNRTATLVGPEGRLRVFDDGFEWIGPDGTKRDQSRPAARKRGSEPEVPHAVAAIAESLARMLDPGVPDPGPVDHASILAAGQAALLSARTGQAESPATIKRMAAV